MRTREEVERLIAALTESPVHARLADATGVPGWIAQKVRGKSATHYQVWAPMDLEGVSWKEWWVRPRELTREDAIEFLMKHWVPDALAFLETK